MRSFDPPRSGTAERQLAAQPRRPVTGPRPTQAPRQLARGAGARVAAPAQAPRPSDGLPEGLRTAIEAMSGFSLADVVVHRNSAEPARLGAAAFTKGNQIHVAPGEDRHLAHEAWHVVQQKQGRVKPTLQLKGERLNDAAALEAEADRMGGMAQRTGPFPGPGRLLGGYVAAPVVQRTISHNGSNVTYSYVEWMRGKASRTVAHFIDAVEPYRARKDFNRGTDLAADEIELIDGRRKYLLGETHAEALGLRQDQSKWASDVAPWDVPLMMEGAAVIPASDRVGLPRMLYSNLQPLENLHAYLMGAALTANAGLAQLHRTAAADLRSLAKLDRDFEIGPFLGALLDSVAQYQAFLDTCQGKPDLPERTLAVRDFAARYVGLGPKFAQLAHAFQTLKSQRGRNPDSTGLSLTSMARPQDAELGEIERIRPCLPELAKSFRILLGITLAGPKGDWEGLEIENAADTPPRSAGATASTVSPARERAMIAAINSHPAPLLVSLGSDHLDRVAQGVGPQAVKITFAMPLRDATLRGPGDVPAGRIATALKWVASSRLATASLGIFGGRGESAGRAGAGAADQAAPSDEQV